MIFIVLCIITGYLAWRGSGNIFRAIKSGLVIPFGSMCMFGALVGRAEFATMGFGWIMIGTVAAMGVWYFMHVRG